MTNKTAISIGDVFEVALGNESKACFQFIMLDSTQLNSEVIRGFRTKYDMNELLDPAKVVQDEVQFHAHAIIKFGIKMKFWRKIGNAPLDQSIEVPYFRMADDDDDPDVQWKQSNKWSIWQANKDFQSIGKLTDKHRNYDIGLVINPQGILELFRGNKYPAYYPD